MKFCKLLVFSAIFSALLPAGMKAASASTPIRIYFEGKLIQTDAPPEIVNDRTMVPLRVISETLGADVSWEDKTRTVTVKKADLTNTLVIGNAKAVFATKTGKATINLDSPPYIKNSRTMVPLRYLAESLGLDVGWDGGVRAVYINKVQPIPNSGPLSFLKFKEMGHFSEGLAAVVNDKDKLGYIDINGKIVIDYQFDRDLNTTDDTKHDYIPQGPAPYYDDYNIHKYAFNKSGYAHVKKNGEYFFIDKNGKRIDGISADGSQVGAETEKSPKPLGGFQEISADSYGKGLSEMIEYKNRGQYIVPLQEWFYDELYDRSQFQRKFFLTAADGRIAYDCTQAVINIIRPYVPNFKLEDFNDGWYLIGVEWDPSANVCYLWQAPTIRSKARLLGFWKVDI